MSLCNQNSIKNIWGADGWEWPLAFTACWAQWVLQDGEGPKLSSTEEYTLSKGWLSCSTNSKQWPSQLREFTYSTVYTVVCFVTSLTCTDETNNRGIPGILWNTDLEHLCLPSGLEVLGCLLLCLALLLLLCRPLHLGNPQSRTHLDLLSCSG